MPDHIYAITNSSAATGVKIMRFDFATGSWSVLKTGAPSGSSTSHFGGCWDGSAYYVQLSDARLYKYDPATNNITVCAGGALFPFGSSFTSDGSFVWYLSGSNGGGFGYYDRASDTINALAQPPGAPVGHQAQIVWDYGNRLYCAWRSNTGGSFCYRFDLTARTWATEVAPPAAPSQPNGFGCWFSQNKLFYYNASDANASSAVYSMPVPGGAAWTLEKAGGQPGADSSKTFSTPVSATLTFVHNYLLYDSAAKTYTSFTSAGSNTPFNTAFTISIQSVFTFLEKDGITPQLSTNPVGGSASRFFGGQITGVYTYALKSAFPRNAVALQVVANPNVDITSGVEIAPSPSGPWAQTANLGAFAQNQIKPYYVRLTIPNPTTPGTKPFSLLATSS